MKKTVERVHQWSDKAGPSLRHSYNKAIGDFPSRTFNISLQTVSNPHTDQCNLAQGWCSITPLGNFDPKKGGHLILWDFGLVTELPPGTTALIPSALVCHSNTTIQEGETRFSIVQYASGRMFRWVHNGLATNAKWLEQATPQDIEIHNSEQAGRWKGAAMSYSTLEELLGQGDKD